MKTVFIKSGGYYETPGISISCAINDVLGFSLNQFNKTDQSFKFDCFDGEYRLYLAHHIPNATYVWKTVDFDFLTEQVEKYGFAYFGVVTPSRTVITHAEILDKLTTIAVDPKTGKFIDCVTGLVLEGDNIVPVIYAVKMANDTYAAVLSAMARVDAYFANDDGAVHPSGNVATIIADDGSAMRDQFIDLKFTNAVKHFKNNDLVIGYAVFAKPGQTVEVDIFKTAPYVTEEFKKNFEIVVDSNFSHVVDNSRVIFETPAEKGMGYLTITLKMTELYADISSREIKENLSFDFIVSIV